MQEEARRPIPAVQMRGEEARCPIHTPRRRTQDRPIPAPRTKKQQSVPAARTKINEKRRALNGFTKLYEIELRSNRDALEMPFVMCSPGRETSSFYGQLEGV